jgi:dipeptidyl aminopeptidase/acylaminoacyl peptidase
LGAQALNIFTPGKKKELKNVLIFIHGGNWNSGNKSLYSYLGSRMARKNVITVIIDYPLSPKANYHQMATSAVTAVQWVQHNIDRYGGDPNRIFVSGHSAGGHLAALITLQKEYFNKLNIPNPIKGCILIDAAGLDMYGYLKEENKGEGHTYLQTFTSDPEEWKKASPIFHLHEEMQPFLIYRGEKTYPSIIKSTEKFVKVLSTLTPTPRYYVLKRKRHIPMITQFLWTWNPLYKEITDFMKAQR